LLFFFQIITEMFSYRYIFEKYSNTNFHENPSSDSWVVPCGKADRDDETSSTFSQFSNAAQKDI